MLLSVEEGHLASQSGDELALQSGVLGKMMRSEGEGEVRMGGQFGKPPDAVGGGEDLSAVVLHCDGDAMLGGGIGIAPTMRYIATGSHFETLVTGVIDTADLVYFAVVMAICMVLSKAALESVRWR